MTFYVSILGAFREGVRDRMYFSFVVYTQDNVIRYLMIFMNGWAGVICRIRNDYMHHVAPVLFGLLGVSSTPDCL